MEVLIVLFAGLLLIRSRGSIVKAIVVLLRIFGRTLIIAFTFLFKLIGGLIARVRPRTLLRVAFTKSSRKRKTRRRRRR